MEHFAKSDIGRVRRKNEDAFLIDRDLKLFAVADGMGGHQAGEVASSLALATLRESLRQEVIGEYEDAMRLAVREANARVFEESLARGHVQGMGTTLTALWIPDPTRPEFALIGHVGDSRCYRLRDGVLDQMTRDHSWVQAQIDDGLLTKEEAQFHPQRNVITRSIGFEREIEGDLYGLNAKPGDVYLLASDGLTGKIGDVDIGRILQGGRETGYPAVLEALIATANARGGEDNITVVIVVC